MDGNFLTSGDLAMWDAARTSRGTVAYDGGYCYERRHDGRATTGIGLAAGLGGGALLLAIAGLWGVNQASKARSHGVEKQAEANAKTIETLANVVAREVNRQDTINIDVQQTQRTLATAFGTGGSATSSALAQAEALALLANSNNGTGVNSAIGGCNYLRVAQVSGSRLCGCQGSCEG